MKQTPVLAAMLAASFLASPSAEGGTQWGRLANPGFEDQPIKSAFFFTGSARDGTPFYEFHPSANTGLYTIHPSDARHLEWSESEPNRAFALDTMIAAGINVVNMSYWGPRGTDNWAYWAPMQTSTYSHDELFQTALAKGILIAPYIEACAETAQSAGYSFADCFPGTLDNPAPELVTRIKDLIERYLLHPPDRRWAEKWARVYDRTGEERYLVCLIGVASNQEGLTDQGFAEGFDRVADRVYLNTGVRVGFAIDAMPPDTYVWAPFLPSAEKTGPWLVRQSSVLAIQCYITGHSIGVNDEDTIIAWKQRLSSKWINTGIPFIQDVSPGYDAMVGVRTEIVFDEEPGFNVGWFDAGDWLDCLIDVRQAGTYDVVRRVALADGQSAGLGQLRVGGSPLCTFSAPATGGWQKWQTISGKVRLTAGRQTLRVQVDKGPWNLNWLRFTRPSR